MSRIPELRPEAMSAEQRVVMEEIVSGPHGRIVGPYPAWLQSPELARRARALSEQIRFQSSLPERLKELAILMAGRHWTAEYEYFAHARLARKAGLEDAIIGAIAARKRPTFAQAHDEIVYDVCHELFETHRLSEGTYGRAVKAFGLPSLVELVATIGYYSLVSLTLNAFEVPLPPGERSPFPD
jgi:4-carboxymuconolactone decarboxylase